MIFNISWIIVGPSFINIPPVSIHSYYLQWILSFLRDVLLIYPSISLAIIYECTIEWKCCISIALPPAHCVIAGTVKGFGRTWFTFSIPCSPKYPCVWFCISSIRICSSTLNIFLRLYQYLPLLKGVPSHIC